MTLDFTDLDSAARSVAAAMDAALVDEESRHALGHADLREAAFTYLDRGGKRLRPLLVHLAAGAVGGDPARVGPTALAVEVFHTWTLIHDDLIDNDDRRRGGPSVHVEFRDRALAGGVAHGDHAANYGAAVAILAGDYLQALASRLVLDNGRIAGISASTVHAAARLMQSDLVRDLVDGEIRDVALTQCPLAEIDEDALIEMYRLKTGALIAYCARVGAMLALDTADGFSGLPERLAGFAERCGIAFQIQDDVLGVSGDEARLGKPVGADIREGKRTLVLRHAYLDAGPDERRRIETAVGNPAASPGEIAGVMEILASRGALEKARIRAECYVEEALGLLAMIPASHYRDLLTEWARGLVHRDT